MSEQVILARYNRLSDIMISPFVSENRYGRLKQKFADLNADLAEIAWNKIQEAGSPNLTDQSVIIDQVWDIRLKGVAELYQESPLPFNEALEMVRRLAEGNVNSILTMDCTMVNCVAPIPFLSFESLNVETALITFASSYEVDQGIIEGTLGGVLTRRFYSVADILTLVYRFTPAASGVIVDVIDRKYGVNRAMRNASQDLIMLQNERLEEEYA